MCLSLIDAVQQMRAHHEAINTFKSEQVLMATVCWAMLPSSCVYSLFYVALTTDNPMQNEALEANKALAAKDAELKQALAAKVL